MSSDPQTNQDQTPVAGSESGHGGSPAPANPSDVKFTRAAALWSSLILGFLVLIVLLIFIAQNTASTPFVWFNGHSWVLVGRSSP